MAKHELPEVLLVEEVAEYLRVNKQTIYNLLRNGELPAKKIGGQWRFSKVAIDQYLQSVDSMPEVAATEEE